MKTTNFHKLIDKAVQNDKNVYRSHFELADKVQDNDMVMKLIGYGKKSLGSGIAKLADATVEGKKTLMKILSPLDL